MMKDIRHLRRTTTEYFRGDDFASIEVCGRLPSATVVHLIFRPAMSHPGFEALMKNCSEDSKIELFHRIQAEKGIRMMDQFLGGCLIPDSVVEEILQKKDIPVSAATNTYPEVSSRIHKRIVDDYKKYCHSTVDTSGVSPKLLKMVYKYGSEEIVNELFALEEDLCERFNVSWAIQNENLSADTVFRCISLALSRADVTNYTYFVESGLTGKFSSDERIVNHVWNLMKDETDNFSGPFGEHTMKFYFPMTISAEGCSKKIVMEMLQIAAENPSSKIMENLVKDLIRTGFDDDEVYEFVKRSSHVEARNIYDQYRKNLAEAVEIDEDGALVFDLW